MSKEISGNPCPNCGGTTFNIFIFSTVYTCVECGWVGNHSSDSVLIHSDATAEQKKATQKFMQLKELHDQNPDWDLEKLLDHSDEDPSIVEKYWELKSTVSKLFK
ncbi:transcription initiation factor TFIIIB Brf1 subunit/transcription initiation factor TFIIB [Methanohalophilus levihalophilus]|uniref:hypothetical protein n=1 Tax=Methanohalophilus levihalophilus TaxID=1431282 RepID=UPI001AE1993E|nr:hypothetical protein [Methanohalophilus levihalophilus]MBP2029730.1 transcription initiation factor TFIIIB Brf1 subunit/transcription initiation factor TFIIB [Methanohalophilus levihalophilus]